MKFFKKLVLKKIKINDFVNNGFKFIDNSISNLILKLENNSIGLENLCLLPLVGVKTGYNEGFSNSKTIYSKPYIFGRDIKRYNPPISNSQIFFPYNFSNEVYNLIDENTTELAELAERDKLEKRAIIKDGILNGTKKWYEFQQINKKINFDEEFIVYPNVSLGNNFTLCSGKIIDMTGFIIPSNSKYLLCILNSKVVKFLMEIYAISRRGGYLEYKIQYISKLPIKNISTEQQQPFITLADQMLSLNTNLQARRQRFLKSLSNNFNGIKITGALEHFYEMDFKQFIEALKKQKVPFSLKQQEEWEEHFTTYKSECTTFATQIATTDKEIDRKVYELYGLTEEEVKIIEGKN